jgi:hypothetical protein
MKVPHCCMIIESIRNPSHQHKAQTANDQDEVFQPFSQSVLVTVLLNASFDIELLQ